MRYNNGPAFVHPVTQQVVQSDQWYEGNAHVEIENEEFVAVSDATTEDVVDDDGTNVFACEFCGKEYKTQKNFDVHLEKCDKKPDGEQVNADADVSE